MSTSSGSPNGARAAPASGSRASLRPGPGDALVVVDLQRDFLPGGALGIANGDRTLPVNDAWLRRFEARGLPVFLTRDWHPADHCSFAARGGPWPVHCVRDTPGAAFADGLHLPPRAAIVSKATDRDREAYSAFEGTGLAQRLRAEGVTRIFIGGLATDYCVVNTTHDARAAGFDVVVLRDAIAAVDVRPGDGERAIARMSEEGASVVDSADVPAD